MKKLSIGHVLKIGRSECFSPDEVKF